MFSKASIENDYYAYVKLVCEAYGTSYLVVLEVEDDLWLKM